MKRTRTRPDVSVSIILATYNEREIIRTTVRETLGAIPDDGEVIVVDDDSPDGTARLVASLRDPRVRVIRRVGTRGLASAIHRGIIESRGAVVGWMDADMSMPPRLLPRMRTELRRYDVVVGSRYAPGGKDDRSFLRVASSRLVNMFAVFMLGLPVRDADSGFVLLRRSVFDRVTMIPTGYGQYFIGFLSACHRKRLRIGEVGYVFREREKGTSKSAPNLLAFAMTGAAYFTRILAERFRRID